MEFSLLLFLNPDCIKVVQNEEYWNNVPMVNILYKNSNNNNKIIRIDYKSV